MAELLRSSLNSNVGRLVPLHDEINLVNNYLES
ncbi:hypothetical protein [Chryseobacterium soli]